MLPIRTVLFVSALFLRPSAASAGDLVCDLYGEELISELKQINGFQIERDSLSRELEKSITHCESSSRKIGEDAAVQAGGRSCEAFQESAKLQNALQELTEDCEQRFAELRRRQLAMKLSLAPVAIDILAGAEIAGKSATLRRSCPKEARMSAGISDALEALEKSVLLLGSRALTARAGYVRLKDGSGRFEQLALERSQDCASFGSASAELSRSARGSAPAGSTPPPRTASHAGKSSTITGRIEQDPIPNGDWRAERVVMAKGTGLGAYAAPEEGRNEALMQARKPGESSASGGPASSRAPASGTRLAASAAPSRPGSAGAAADAGEAVAGGSGEALFREGVDGELELWKILLAVPDREPSAGSGGAEAAGGATGEPGKTAEAGGDPLATKPEEPEGDSSLFERVHGAYSRAALNDADQ